MVMLLLFWTFSANLPVFLKNQSCRLSWVIWSCDGTWIQTNVGCISRTKCIKSQLKPWICKELFQLVINTSQCNTEEYKCTVCCCMCKQWKEYWNSRFSSVAYSSKGFCEITLWWCLHCQWGNYPCNETQAYSFYLKKGSNCMESQASV